MLVNHKHVVTVQMDRTPHPAAYLEVGSGTPVLMLHGFFGDKTNWVPLIDQLKSHCRCVSLDMMGFGESSKPEIRYDVATEVAFVRQVVEALDLDPCYIIGHSFGSWVAAAYALKYTSSVTGLVLTGPAGIRDDTFCGRYDSLRPLLWQTPLVDWAMQLAKPFVPTSKRTTFETICWFRKQLVTQPVARSFLVNRMRPEDAVDTVEKEIHRLQAPTLVIAGECDDTIPLWHSETYAREILGAVLAIIPGAGHDLPQSYAPEMAKFILPFLNSQTVGDRLCTASH